MSGKSKMYKEYNKETGELIKKECPHCGEIKDVSCFSKNKRVKDGVQTECKQCYSGRRHEYRENNKEKISEKHRQYCENNKKKISNYQHQYYENNKEKISERKRQRYKSNKEIDK